PTDSRRLQRRRAEVRARRSQQIRWLKNQVGRRRRALSNPWRSAPRPPWLRSASPRQSRCQKANPRPIQNHLGTTWLPRSSAETPMGMVPSFGLGHRDWKRSTSQKPTLLARRNHRRRRSRRKGFRRHPSLKQLPRSTRRPHGPSRRTSRCCRTRPARLWRLRRGALSHRLRTKHLSLRSRRPSSRLPALGT
ncbi:unnamed protein product, partial [Symbiodinium sp. CCMP2456]